MILVGSFREGCVDFQLVSERGQVGAWVFGHGLALSQWAYILGLFACWRVGRLAKPAPSADARFRRPPHHASAGPNWAGGRVLTQ